MRAFPEAAADNVDEGEEAPVQDFVNALGSTTRGISEYDDKRYPNTVLLKVYSSALDDYGLNFTPPAAWERYEVERRESKAFDCRFIHWCCDFSDWA
jgi:hypothetical protein